MADFQTFHRGEHTHVLDHSGSSKVTQTHSHAHSHLASELARGHDESSDHRHVHEESDPKGTVEEMFDPPAGWIPPVDPTKAAKIDRLEKLAVGAPDPDLRAGAGALAADIRKAALLDAAEQFESAQKVTTADLVKSAFAAEMAKSKLGADLNRLRSDMDKFCRDRGIRQTGATNTAPRRR